MTDDTRPILAWFRHDLRLTDNEALAAAAEAGGPVIPVFILDEEGEGEWPAGGAARWWMRRSLSVLGAELETAGSRLVLRRGAAAKALVELARETGAGRMVCTRRYEPCALDQERGVRGALREAGVETRVFPGALLFEPEQIRNKSGDPYRVFTPFWKALLALADPPRPLPAPRALPAPDPWPRSLAVGDLGFEPAVDCAGGLRENWAPGERGAEKQLAVFLDEGVDSYDRDRNRPDTDATSRLSPHLHFGEVSPRTVWHETTGQSCADAERRGGSWLRQLVWREFSAHLLVSNPQTDLRPLRPEFGAFPWRDDPDGLRAWQRGETGYPFVDAGMRQLRATGWMHNRVRMVAASFLVKDLLVPWQEGARWFWDTLVDADLANNTMGWQWTSGCGADAAPYFRVFNPVGQGERFDPDGTYVMRWAPELAGLPPRWIHRPWEAPESVLDEAGVRLGETYPRPILDHRTARIRALAALSKITRRTAP